MAVVSESEARPGQAGPETRSGDPRTEYTRRLEARRAMAARQARLYPIIGGLRLAVLIAGGVVLWRLLGGGPSVLAWALLPLGILFGSLVVVQERVFQTRRRFERAAAFYERGLARLEDRWAGKGITGERFLNEAHPYAADLDIFGKGSLFELLCTARTRAGEETLAAWLSHAAAPEEVSARQAAVDELRPRLDLREELALLGDEVRSGLHPEALAAWSAATPVFSSRAARVTAAVLAALTWVAIMLWMGGFGLIPFWVMVVIEVAFAYPLRPRVRRVIREVEQPGRDLALLAQVLGRFEREPFASTRLVALRAELETAGRPPSRQIARLHRLINLLDWRLNQLFRPLSMPLLWATQFAFAVEAWRKAAGPAVARWLAAVGEIEALCALAGYAYEHPDDPFPEFTEQAVGFDGEGIGHPLIPEGRCVRTDLRLGGDLRVLIVSGSNMSGKSTLLRTVGTNAVLAQAGAPVRARRLRLSPLAVGASIRINDSLQTGVSRFYAEITRLRQLMDLTKGPLPLLFLLDEILHGTNSHDRRIGAEAVVRGLVERGAIGLVTTHDLALAQITDDLAVHAANVHFEDHLENGKMTFDYRLRPGVVRKSNALELMRSVGLEV